MQLELLCVLFPLYVILETVLNFPPIFVYIHDMKSQLNSFQLHVVTIQNVVKFRRG